MSHAPRFVSTAIISSINRPLSATGEADKPLRPSPGDLATPLDIRQLADEYRTAAYTLLETRRKRQPLSLAPCRLSAIQAIELYLNALLLHRDFKASGLRALQHDFGARTDMAIASGLVLRKGTQEHLREMTGKREYVISRYGPEMSSSLSQINRLMATLDEVAKKVSSIIPPETKKNHYISQSLRLSAASS